MLTYSDEGLPMSSCRCLPVPGPGWRCRPPVSQAGGDQGLLGVPPDEQAAVSIAVRQRKDTGHQPPARMLGGPPILAT